MENTWVKYQYSPGNHAWKWNTSWLQVTAYPVFYWPPHRCQKKEAASSCCVLWKMWDRRNTLCWRWETAFQRLLLKTSRAWWLLNSEGSWPLNSFQNQLSTGESLPGLKAKALKSLQKLLSSEINNKYLKQLINEGRDGFHSAEHHSFKELSVGGGGEPDVTS